MNVDLSEAEWFKSSHSSAQGECVEVALLAGGAVGVRDSKNATGSALVFMPSAWDAFVTGVQTGEFDAG
ncbi:Domain of uncharacterised function (DUF397) [Nocardia otitidiscaviarum]|uniref:Domain of uncharacterized function (DUF397) n=1 Tax=Nocardia otitidiscaviarum TaxID=1823 RepID=A0A378YLU3_9NOCA|nr:DUF397 domain-containing protein [Nocardia otitidiscaviarum]MBF6240609.1 DUF397 domain-containing protein [Nocardia otitidiscaviarum]SUA77540.1 Domain of uncharacterised function (DUF397) [Nocardia otitidiscaviarum]